MRQQTISRKPLSVGFTLMELMIAVAVVGILAAIAFPSYQNQIRKSRRTEAKSALMDLAAREEKLYSTTNAYTNSAAALGYSTFTPIGSGYYNVTIPNPGTNPATFTITATATGSQAQDTTCFRFIVDQTGVQTSQDSNSTNNTTTGNCWK